MTNPYLEHPDEEALERFLLQRSQDGELEVLETHILACESCITRLEALESELAVMKQALADYRAEQIQKELTPARRTWKDWLTIPTLSWGGAAIAALAVGVAVVPHTTTQNFELTSARGVETAVLPEGHPLNLHMDTADMPTGAADVQVVDATGAQIWQGRTVVNGEKAEVKLPEISQAGTYFLRFYSPSGSPERELVREFRFEVK